MLLRRGPGWAALEAGLLLWQVITTVRVAPISWHMETRLGAVLQVRRYLSDANVDWGQQLKTVRQYLDQNPRVLVCLLSGWCRTASRLWHSLPPPSHPERLVMVQTADGRAASH